MSGPLNGVRVLDLTTALSGPVSTCILGDMGADVIKVEAPEGDSIRDVGPSRHIGMGAMFLHANRSKRSIVLDLKKEDAKDVFLCALSDVDVFVCNVRPKAMARLGLSYEQVTKVNPNLIYLNIVGYGSAGPYNDKPAYDDLIQAAVGIASLGGQDVPARYAPIAIADRVTGILAANAVLGALYHRSVTGYGQHIEIPMFESMASLILADHMQGMTFEPSLGPPVFQRYASIRRPFRTSDGHISMMVLTDRQWCNFFSTVGRLEIMQDERFNTMANRSAHIEQLYSIVSEILSKKTTAFWINTFEAADIPVAKIETIESLLEHPHVVKSEFIETVEHPTEGKIRSLGRTSKWSGTQPEPTRLAPRLGEHSREVLIELGYSEAQIQALFASGAVKGEQE